MKTKTKRKINKKKDVSLNGVLGDEKLFFVIEKFHSKPEGAFFDWVFHPFPLYVKNSLSFFEDVEGESFSHIHNEESVMKFMDLSGKMSEDFLERFSKVLPGGCLKVFSVSEEKDLYIVRMTDEQYKLIVDLRDYDKKLRQIREEIAGVGSIPGGSDLEAKGVMKTFEKGLVASSLKGF